ncbi:MAG: type II toxin-antitoxin system RelE/ParE family toxin [Mesorhizobium sp.]|nr:type II toxin-antitoxin system RelE/ParE family toxin [Mesorhizobium sp.]MBN9243674.1 type II toxin-antitoxin system RelE/ParE family toxin [Mesorhizobium sp.]
MKSVWTAQAKRELGDIVSYIWVDNPAAAKHVRKRIETTASYLKSQPFMGRQGAIAGTREAIPHPSYRIVYQLTGETVFILSIVHTARQWPPVAEDDA